MPKRSCFWTKKVHLPLLSSSEQSLSPWSEVTFYKKSWQMTKEIRFTFQDQE